MTKCQYKKGLYQVNSKQQTAQHLHTFAAYITSPYLLAKRLKTLLVHSSRHINATFVVVTAAISPHNSSKQHHLRHALGIVQWRSQKAT